MSSTHVQTVRQTTRLANEQARREFNNGSVDGEPDEVKDVTVGVTHLNVTPPVTPPEPPPIPTQAAKPKPRSKPAPRMTVEELATPVEAGPGFLFKAASAAVEHRLRIAAGLIMAGVPTLSILSWQFGMLEMYSALFVAFATMFAFTVVGGVVHKTLVKAGRVVINIKMIGRLAVFAVLTFLLVFGNYVAFNYAILGGFLWLGSEVILIHAILDSK